MTPAPLLRPARIAGAVVLAATVVAVLWGLSLGFHFERTEEAIYETDVGASMLQVVWVGIPLSVAAIVTRRPRVGGVLALTGALVVAASAGRAASDLRPEAGERRVAAAFPPPGEAVRDASRWTGYAFPSLSLAWRTSDPLPVACDAAAASMRAWSDAPPTQRVLERSCFVAGRRDGHRGSVYVGPHPDDRRALRLHLTITRDV